MKKTINKKLVGLILWFLFSFCTIPNVEAQDIIVVESDTLITITPGELKTINSWIVDLEGTKKTLSLISAKSQLDSVLIQAQDSIITGMGDKIELLELQKNIQTDLQAEREKQWKKEKRRSKLRNIGWGILAGVIGLFTGMTIAN